MEKLKKQISKKEFSNCYLFYGLESYLINKYISEIIDSLNLKDDIMNFITFEGKEAELINIVDAFCTLPFLAENRIVLVKGSQLFTKGRKDGEILIEGLKELPPSTILIFWEDKVEKNLKTYKAIAKVADVYNVEKGDEKDLISFVQKELGKSGKTIEKGNAVYFLHSISTDMKKILLEVNKLTNYVEGDEITKKDIDLVCSKTLEYKVFTLISSMGDKKAINAFDIYNKLIESKESPLMILALISRHMKMLFQTKILLAEKKTADKICKELGVPSFVVREYIKQSKSFTSKELYLSIEKCLVTDVSIKTGVYSDYDGVWNLILEFAT